MNKAALTEEINMTNNSFDKEYKTSLYESEFEDLNNKQEDYYDKFIDIEEEIEDDDIYLDDSDDIEMQKDEILSEEYDDYDDFSEEYDDYDDFSEEDDEQTDDIEMQEEEILSKEYDDSDDDLIEEEIEDVIINKNGITSFFKKIFSKKEKETNKKETPKLFIPFVFVGKKVSNIFKYLGNKISNKVEKRKEKKIKKEESIEEKFTDLSLTKKIEKYLEGTSITQGELTDIFEKIDFIISSKKGNEQQDDINKFLNENINVTSHEDRLDNLMIFIEEKCLLISNSKVKTIKDIIDVYSLSDNEVIIKLFNEIINSDDYKKIDRLYNFALNDDNFKENIIKEMYQILGKKVENQTQLKPKVKTQTKNENQTQLKPEVKTQTKNENQTQLKPEVKTQTKNENQTQLKPEVKTQTKNENQTQLKPEVKVQTENETSKKVNSLEKAYNKYKEILNTYEEKNKELELLKSEYNIFKKAVFGKDLDFISRENPTKRQLENIKDRILKVRVLVSEENFDKLSKMDLTIRQLQKELDVLCNKIRVYNEKDIEGQYKRQCSIEYFDMIWNKELEDIKANRMNDSVSTFEQFSDEEIATICKYKQYEKTL